MCHRTTVTFSNDITDKCSKPLKTWPESVYAPDCTNLYKVEYYTYIVLYVENLFWKQKQETCFTFSEGLDKFGFGAFSQLTLADKTLINMPDWTKKMETQVGRD